MEKPEGHVEDAAGVVDEQVLAAIIAKGADPSKVLSAERRRENTISHETQELARIAALIERTEDELVRVLHRWERDREAAGDVTRDYAKPNETDMLIAALTSLQVRRAKLREEYQVHKDALTRAEQSHLENVLPYERPTADAANQTGTVEESIGNASGFAL